MACTENPGTQAGTQKKDFGTVTQTDLTRVKFRPQHRVLRGLSCIRWGKMV